MCGSAVPTRGPAIERTLIDTGGPALGPFGHPHLRWVPPTAVVLLVVNFGITNLFCVVQCVMRSRPDELPEEISISTLRWLLGDLTVEYVNQLQRQGLIAKSSRGHYPIEA